MFSIEQRIYLLQKVIANIDHDIEPTVIHGLVADFVEKHNVNFLVRGLRSHADLDGEIIMAVMNRRLCGAETVMLIAREGKVHVSSTMIRTLGQYNKKLPNFVPSIIEDEVYDHLFKSFQNNNK